MSFRVQTRKMPLQSSSASVRSAQAGPAGGSLGHIWKRAIAFGLPAFYITILVPLFYWSNYFATDKYLVEVEVWRYWALFCMVVIASNGYILALPNKYNLMAYTLIVWFASSLAWSINPEGTITNLVALIIYLPAVHVVWRFNLKRALFLTEIAIFIGIAMLAIYLGTDGRKIGGITPNMIGHFALAVAFFACLRKPKPFITLILTLLLIVFAEARTILLSFAIFLALRFLFFPIFEKLGARGAPVVLAPPLALLIVALASYILPLAVRLLSGLLNVQNAVRTGTDLTGRTEHWWAGLEVLSKSPLIGYGAFTRGPLSYRLTDDIGAHSGLINLALDVGIIGVIIFVVWYFSAAYWAARMSGSRDLRRIGITCSAFLLGYIPTFVAEPNHISFYAPLGIPLLMCLVMPSAFRGAISRSAK